MKRTDFTLMQRRTATAIVFCLLGAAAAWAQPRPWMPPGAQLQARGTGRTTGHIADLMVVNETDKLINLKLPPTVIPRDRGHQGFAIPAPVEAPIPPNSTVHVPLRGFCTDPDLPPPLLGDLLPPVNTWDPSSPLLPQLQNIIQATADLQQGGQIVTPLGNQPQREREAVIQQTLWWYSLPPGAYDPCVRIRQSISDWYRDTDWYSSNLPNIEQGIAQIADAIARAGQAAGLPEFIPPPIPESIAQPTPAAPPAQPNVANTIRVVGTGRTTGHIADFFAINPTPEPITLRIGQGSSLFIPSNGRDQAYIVPHLPDILINPAQTVTVPIEGYCVDVHRPPLGAAQPAPPVSSWTGSEPLPGTPPAPPAPGSNLVTVPVQTAPPLPQVADLLDRLPRPPAISRWDCPEAPVPTTPLIPGTDTPIRRPINTDEAPGLAMPILAEAVQRIAQSYDELQPRGGINTPFSNNRDREREAVIQQTFWIFTSALQGTPYTKLDFHDNTVRQFENTTNRQYDQLPDDQKERIDQGVDDFWDSFQATGAEAKVLPRVPTPPTLPHREKIEEAFGQPDIYKPGSKY
jgi:hypothetical protein